MNFDIVVDLDLIKKYDRPGPRYTSYPTAPYFHNGIGEPEYKAHIQKDNSTIKNRDLSLYFHLPFCQSLCYFCGCNSFVSRDPLKMDAYIDYLEKEIEMIRPLLDKDRQIAQLHWGGGTPSHFSPQQIQRLGEIIHKHFSFKEDAEVGLEIDPRGMTRDHFVVLHELGFNRCSMGVQDFNPQVQRAVHRIQPEDITLQALEWARELQFDSMNIDLMYGLPFQTEDTFTTTVDKVIAMNPDRLAVFNYAHLPSIFKHQRLIKDETLPKPETKLALFKNTIEQLTDAGYVYIGMDHFAKPDDELTMAMKNGTLYRNFQGYSTHAGLDLLAFGMSSISMLSDLYVQNFKTMEDYYKPLDSGQLPVMRGVELTADDTLRRDVITTLMCNFRLQKSDIEEKYNITFDDYFAESLDQLEIFTRDELLSLEPEVITVEPKGRLLIRNIAMAFDAYLQKKENNKPQFSRTV